MTAAPAIGADDRTTKLTILESGARALAEAHRELGRSPRARARRSTPSQVTNALEHARQYLAATDTGDATLPKASEWFLDNYYLIRRVARQVDEELPPGFVRHLPRIASGPSTGSLRIERLADAVVDRSRVDLEALTVHRFVDAYQEVAPLTIAELWALPVMLRASVLQHLLVFLDRLNVPVGAAGKREVLELDPGIGVERSTRALRLLDAIDWKTFFEKTSRVEAVLREDPASVYPRMDFETCDDYRKVVESLAWTVGRPEPDVARLAITLARDDPSDPRRGHVGYYLLGDGRRELEARLGYRATGRERVRRAVMRWPTLSYLLPIALLTAGPLAALGWVLGHDDRRPLALGVAMLLTLVPLSIVAVTIVQRALARLLPPRRLPKLDFSRGIPVDDRTLVAIPTLLGRAHDVETMLRQIELHFLANPDPELRFALLTDHVDSETMPDDHELLEAAEAGIAALNVRHGKGGPGPFHLLHREPQWSESEQRFMGWERKRGKLEELNRLLRGDTRTTFARHVGDPASLEGIRFVITLDSDTQLPMGSAHRLVGLLAHPLNRALFDPHTGRVVAGYTIVQPRVETSPSSTQETWFSRLFAGDVGFDIYTHAVSETYQDLFGSGIYTGKGIYDVDAFARSVEARVPENALVSHDLFEGVHGRTALASDIVLFEEYPTHYVSYARRMHRWVRGDWQLLPWLMRSVPSARDGRVRNRLSGIDRWKIADNLRRSLTGPIALLLLVLGWMWLPGGARWWTPIALVTLLAPGLPALVHRRMRRENLGRAGLAVAFLAYEAFIVIDAIVRVTVRKLFTRRHLLEWTSAAHTAHAVAARSPRTLHWITMWPSPFVATVVAAAVGWLQPSSLVVAAPFLVIWFLAPELARWVSRPVRERAETLTAADRRKLRLLARRTWRFFDEHVGPGDQWLPIDNYQAEPHEQTAHRTSPTNIGLSLLSTLSAYDFGYIGPGELSIRLRQAFASIARLEHYQGHLLNWYDTKNLQPLLPRYVSTVDSGNLAGCLLALAQGCREVAVAPVVRAESWDGLDDSLVLLDEVLASGPAASVDAIRSVIARMRRTVRHGHDHPHEALATLRALSDVVSADLRRELLGFLDSGAHRHEVDLLHALRTSIEHLQLQLERSRRELETLAPWLVLAGDPVAGAIEPPTDVRLHEIPAHARRLIADLDAWTDERRQRGELTPELAASAQRFGDALRRAGEQATALGDELHALATLAEEEARGMDFRLLYDRERKLFHIGYNATLDRIDPHYYDLLASEARLASYLAIVKRDVPETHWYALGRPMTSVAGAPALLSWGGTMFEYLMPCLLMRSRKGSLLARTSELAVTAQIAAAAPGEPWGVSESAFARVDAHHTYQYRSFGVPGLGFKRGLEDDRVVAPYASLLAVAIRPRAVMDNLERLEAMGMLGTYGLFEALDLTPERAPPGLSHAVVRSYMAHHQGMLLVALGNVLTSRSMVDRFHADVLVETGEMLLNEHAPSVAPPEWPIVDDTRIEGPIATVEAPSPPGPWSPIERAGPQAFVLSNGRLSSLVTDAGGGGLRWQGLALTRYQPDPTLDDDGVWIYLRDEDDRRVWLATAADGRTTFRMHQIDLHRRHHGISVHVDIAVAPADDVEIRRIRLHNETDEPRRLTVTSAGRPVLQDARQASAHPAFSSMFIESERLTDVEGLLFSRRPRSPKDAPVVLVHRLVHEGGAVTGAGFESDRAAFVGRGGSVHAPAALTAQAGPLRGRTGAVLDPVMSLMANVTLRPKRSVTLAFVTAVARSRSAAVALARKYGTMHTVGWAFRDAEQESPRRLQRTNLDPALLPTVQRLFSALSFGDAVPRVRDPRAPLPSRSRLWARGISGDDPIVLVRVNDPESRLLAQVLAAQRYLRSCGAAFDLVLVDELATGYATEASGSLRNVLTRHDASEWIGRNGGIFVLPFDQVPESDRLQLEACARIVLDTREGSLVPRWARPFEGPPTLPRFEAALVEQASAVPRPRPPLRFDNGLGGFTADGREYVVTLAPGRPTPAPWCNVLANPDFGCLVSESSLGVTWSLNSGENRLTPWRNDAVLDPPSEALYLRDEETAAVWSPTPLPAGRDAETHVHHGAGYTTYRRESHGLVQTLTIFVPPDAPLKVVRLRVKNTLTRHRRLTATYYAEWVMGSRREDQRAYIVSEYDRASACLLATCSWNADVADRVAFLASTRETHGFTTDRREFLGRGGDLARPVALERWGLSGSVAPGTDPCAVLQVHLELGPGAEVETEFLLGQAEDRDHALALLTRFRTAGAIEAAWRELGRFWDGVLDEVQVATPEPAMDLVLNRWLLYQSLSARVFGRTGFYQSSGAFGYRDQLQDVMGFLHAAPALARAQILTAAAHQFEEGDVLHWWHPPSGRGVRTRCSDDMLWLPFVTAEYVTATGDVTILDEPVRFLTGAPLRADEHDRYSSYEAGASAATLLEHCRRALERGATAGASGLPLFGDGDWNDGMNRIGAHGRGESVWLGWFLAATMSRFAALCELVADGDAASRWRARAGELRATIERVAWDGAWYLRAFHDDGSLVGSASSRECQIDSIAQSWAVLSTPRGEVAGPRARAAVEAADERLVREADRLVLLFWPPYDSTLHDPGYVRAYPPGIRENGGQYTHASTWLGWAHAALGDGDRAGRIFDLINPILRTQTRAELERYRVEPYAVAADVYSCPPWPGRGGWTWYTGAAAWMWRLGVEAILGLRKERGRLCIDPCIPSGWPGFEAWVRLGRRRIHVVVENPQRVSRGVVAMTLDGVRLAEPRLPDLDPESTGDLEVRVQLGAA
ncbi:MAG: cellobiose phosphorylase [Deltaproteobacteria bacterium]|nr:cellobiose phosphorylase [Kofleriaceae bacterium]